MASTRTPKLDPTVGAAVDLAREAAVEAAGVMGVGDHLGVQAEGDRLATHHFVCPHPGYQGWRWAVTLVRASRAKSVTINEVVLLPSQEALQPPRWVPWSERVQAGDVTAGLVMATPDHDPRLEPGFTGGERAADADPAEYAQARAVVAELGLGRERVLSREGRDLTVERWLSGDGGPDNQSTKLAPGVCESCGYFARLSGGLGLLFGACTNEFSPADGTVVSVDHGCGAHSDVVADEQGVDLGSPVWDTISLDESLFD